MNKLYGTAILLTTATPAFAHPGHDHSHWLAEPVHAVTALAIAAIAGTATYLLRQRSNAHKTKK